MRLKDESIKNPKTDQPSLATAWEETEGPIHMEALSLVARQCQDKTKKLLQGQPISLADKISHANDMIKVHIIIK